MLELEVDRGGSTKLLYSRIGKRLVQSKEGAGNFSSISWTISEGMDKIGSSVEGTMVGFGLRPWIERASVVGERGPKYFYLLDLL